DISKLERGEVSGAVQLFNRYGLWGERSNWSDQRKSQFIGQDCSSYLPSLLVDVIKSQHITERYSEILKACSNKGEIEALLICAFVLEAIGLVPRTANIQELLANRVHWGKLRSQAELRAIVDFDARHIKAKS